MENLRKFLTFLRHKLNKTKRGNPKMIKFSDFFICDKFFHLIGFSFFKPNAQKSLKFLFIFSQLLIFLMLALVLVNLSFHFESLEIAIIIENFATIAIFGAILIKVFSLIRWHSVKIRKVLTRLEVIFATQQNSCGENEKCLKTLEKFFIMSLVCYMTIFVSFTCTPLIYEVFFNENKEKRIVILNFYNPLGYERSGIFELLFVLIFCTFLLQTILILCTDFFFVVISQVISAEINNLTLQINETDLRNESEAIEKLKKIIKTHQEFLEIIKDVNEIFSIPLFVNVFAVILVICFCGFLATVKLLFKL